MTSPVHTPPHPLPVGVHLVALVSVLQEVDDNGPQDGLQIVEPKGVEALGEQLAGKGVAPEDDVNLSSQHSLHLVDQDLG